MQILNPRNIECVVQFALPGHKKSTSACKNK